MISMAGEPYHYPWESGAVFRKKQILINETSDGGIQWQIQKYMQNELQQTQNRNGRSEMQTKLRWKYKRKRAVGTLARWVEEQAVGLDLWLIEQFAAQENSSFIAPPNTNTKQNCSTVTLGGHAISNSLPKANTKTFTLNILLPRQIHLTLQMHKYEYKAQSDTGAGAGDVSLSQRKPASSWANWNYQRWSQNISTGVKTAFWMLSVKIDNRWRLDFEPNIVVTKKRDETEVKHFRAALTFKRKGALT